MMETEAELLPLLETLYASKNPTRRWLHCTRRDWIIARIRECARIMPGRALEVGFGAGVYLPALAENYTEVVASDLEQAHLSHAHALALKYPHLQLVTDDITRPRLPPRSFSLILCSEVVEHIADSIAALNGMHRLLAPGGILILSTPQRRSLLEMACKVAFMPGLISLVRRIYAEPVFETGHINLLSAREAARRIEAAGFTITTRYKSGMYIPVLAEFGGGAGLRCERRLEHWLRGSALDWMLWTQYYIARA
ncbi:MAG: class I SAM-dependent methyltransferase [Candidatus Binataceae bacterium]